jgi:hypothetical protein
VQIGFLVLSDASEALNGKLYALGAGWNTLRFPALPAEFGFRIGLGLDVDWGDTNRRHQLELQVQDPDGGHVGDAFTLEFEAGRPPGTPVGQEQRMVLSLGGVWTFEVSGPHAVVVSVDGEEIGRTRFFVVQV